MQNIQRNEATDGLLIKRVLERSCYHVMGGNHNSITPRDFALLFNLALSADVMEAHAQEMLRIIDVVDTSRRASQINNPEASATRYQFSSIDLGNVTIYPTDLTSSRAKVLQKVFAKAQEQSPNQLVEFLDATPNQERSYLGYVYMIACDFCSFILGEEVMGPVIRVAVAVASCAAFMTVMPSIFAGGAALAGKVTPFCAEMLSPSVLTALGQVSALFASITIEDILATWIISLLGMMFNDRVLHIPYLNAAIAGLNTALLVCVWDLVTPTVILAEGIAFGVKNFMSLGLLEAFCRAEVNSMIELGIEAKRHRISQEWQRLIDTYAPGQEGRSEPPGFICSNSGEFGLLSPRDSNSIDTATQDAINAAREEGWG